MLAALNVWNQSAAGVLLSVNPSGGQVFKTGRSLYNVTTLQFAIPVSYIAELAVSRQTVQQTRVPRNQIYCGQHQAPQEGNY